MKFFLSAIALFGIVSDSRCDKSSQLTERTLNIAMTKCTSASTRGLKATLCFDSVVSDSRCPANAICVWQGTAEAAFTFKTSARTTHFRLALMNKEGLYRKDTIVEGRKIEFMELNPYPGLPGNEKAAVTCVVKISVM